MRAKLTDLPRPERLLHALVMTGKVFVCSWWVVPITGLETFISGLPAVVKAETTYAPLCGVLVHTEIGFVHEGYFADVTPVLFGGEVKRVFPNMSDQFLDV